MFNFINKALSYVLYPALSSKQLKKDADLLPVNTELGQWESLTCEINKDIILKGFKFTPNSENIDESKGPMFYFWGNNTHIVSNKFEYLQERAIDYKRPVISYFNRGIGKSTGKFKSAKDLVEDAVAIVENHVTKEDSNKALIFGYSLGGAQVTIAAHELYKKGYRPKVYNWNSFKSMNDACMGVIGPKRGGVVGSFITALFFGLVTGTLSIYLILSSILAGLVLGIIKPNLAKKLCMYTFVIPILKLSSWELNPMEPGIKLYKEGLLDYGQVQATSKPGKKCENGTVMDSKYNHRDLLLEKGSTFAEGIRESDNLFFDKNNPDFKDKKKVPIESIPDGKRGHSLLPEYTKGRYTNTYTKIG